VVAEKSYGLTSGLRRLARTTPADDGHRDRRLPDLFCCLLDHPRAPKTWWLWSGVAFSRLDRLLIIGIFLIEPLFNTYKSRRPGRCATRWWPCQAVACRRTRSDLTTVPAIQPLHANAGRLFGYGRVAMSDVMFKKDADQAEVKGVGATRWATMCASTS